MKQITGSELSDRANRVIGNLSESDILFPAGLSVLVKALHGIYEYTITIIICSTAVVVALLYTWN